MRIYFSPRQTPMLLNTLKEMNELHDKLNLFLASTETGISVEAELYGSAEPYSELLRGLHVEKGQGLVNLSITETRWLNLTGSPENLRRYVSHFHFDVDGEYDHHHPEYPYSDGYMQSGSMELIIEVRSDVIEDMRSQRH